MMAGIHTHWAEEYAALELRLADVAAERDAYQEIAYAALDQLHSTALALNRTRTQLQRLVAASRAARVDRIAGAAA